VRKRPTLFFFSEQKESSGERKTDELGSDHRTARSQPKTRSTMMTKQINAMARRYKQDVLRIVIAPLVARAREIYGTIGNAYTALSRGPTPAAEVVESPLYRAQVLNNGLFFGMVGAFYWRDSVSAIEADVRSGRRVDYLRATEDLEARIADLEALRAAWLAFAAEQ
jgi:hypothetical protein